MSAQIDYEKLREEMTRQIECLPIWIGCKVYQIHSNTDRITERTITSISFSDSSNYAFVLYANNYSMFEPEIGKTVFLKKEDAEEAIAKRKTK